MATEHNPDHVMTEGQIPVGDDTLDELGEEFLEDLSDVALPVLNDEVAHSAPAGTHSTQSGEPAAKKLCGEGQSSAAGPSGVASASTSAPPSIPRASSSGSSDATAPALGRAIAPSAPRPAPASRSRPVQPEPEPEHAAAGAASGLAPNVRFQNLRRHRTMVGTTLHTLTRNTQSLVDVIFPESSAEEVRAAVLARNSLPWLSDIRLFHRLKDPYDDSAYSQLLALPVAAEGDVGFERIPAVLWLPGQEDPVLLNISSHSCSVCSRRLIGQQPAPAAFKKDPGLFLIGVDLDVEVWTCSLCDFTCGLALDSAMYHIASETHRKRLQAHLPAVKEKYGAWRVSTLLQHQNISAFLQ
ncbi:unnamed protein product [Closterium sp. NIES-65]|nr:unnamed protein product [Closterium sp. NIES-65]